MNKLIIRRESYRQWFEFYKLALNSKVDNVVQAVKTTKDFYEPWGDVLNTKFDDWWKKHDHLFDEPQVILIESLEQRQTDNSVIVEIPMNRAVSALLVDVKKILEKHTKKKPNYRKRKTVFSKNYRMTVGSEPKLKTLKDVLKIYRDVYLKNKKLRGQKFHCAVRDYYGARVSNKKIPSSIVVGHESSMRNLRRWIQWGDAIVLNVANGEFPGVYGNN